MLFSVLKHVKLLVEFRRASFGGARLGQYVANFKYRFSRTTLNASSEFALTGIKIQVSIH